MGWLATHFKTAALNHSATRPTGASLAHSTASFKPATTSDEFEKNQNGKVHLLLRMPSHSG
jgi:hypothetical protein